MSVSAIVFLTLFAGSLLLALVRSPIFGLYAYFMAFYGFPPGRWWGGDLPDIRWSLVAAAVTMVAVLRSKPASNHDAWYANPAAVLLIAFTVWIWIQSFWALSPDDHTTLAVMYAKYLVLFFILHRILATDKLISNLFLAHIVGCAYFGWIAFRTAGAGRFELIGGPGMNGASAFGSHMTTGLIFAGVMLFQTRGASRIIVLLTIPFILNAIILTQSRGAFLGLLAGGIATLFLSPTRYRKSFYAIGSLGVVLLSILAHDVFLERMGTIINAVEQNDAMDGSAESRWLIIDAQWEMFKQSPVLGTGHRGTVVLSPEYLDARWLFEGGRSSHNTVMTVIVEQGIIGTMIYAALALWVAGTLLRLKSLDVWHTQHSLAIYRTGIGAALVSLFVGGMFADYLRLEITIWCLVLLVAVSRLAHQTAMGKDNS